MLDFGCGGGFVLKALNCARRVGVEINPHARRVAAANAVDIHEMLSEVEDASVDVAISSHALEHVRRPLDTLEEVHRTVKPGGLTVFVVPSERYDTAYVPDNIDQHLYTWSPVNLGNLFRHAGFEVLEVKRHAHRWPPVSYSMNAKIEKVCGRRLYNLLCRVHGYLRPKLTQIRVVARRPL